MPDAIRNGPWPILALFLLVVVTARSHGTYWLGRGVAAGLLRSRFAARLTSDNATRAKAWIDRWGWPAIPVAYLTIGLQSAVFLTAGAMRMGYPRFAIASIPGCVAWAVLYATGGLAIWEAALLLAARSVWALVAALVGVGAIVFLLVRRARRSRARSDGAASSPDAVPPAVTPTRAAEPQAVRTGDAGSQPGLAGESTAAP